MPSSIPGQRPSSSFIVTDSIFLKEAPKLHDLYKYIGVTKASSVYFYLNVVFKNFNHLRSEGRVHHLMYVRDYLLHHRRDGYNSMLSALKQLPFIPNHCGRLCTAKDFYDPENEVFKKFVAEREVSSKAIRFRGVERFLVKAGLQRVVTEEHICSMPVNYRRNLAILLIQIRMKQKKC